MFIDDAETYSVESFNDKHTMLVVERTGLSGTEVELSINLTVYAALNYLTSLKLYVGN